MSYRLQRQKSGALAVHNAAYAETMHPGAGPWAEANGLYVQGTGLAAALTRRAAQGPLVLFDVGLGAAANALAAVTCHATLQREGHRPRPLHLVSFESDPAGAHFALEQAEALGYPRGHEVLLRDLLATGRAGDGETLTWELRQGDFTRLIDEEPARAEIVFWDPFSPRTNPEMWSLGVLEALYQCRKRAAPLRLATYSMAFGSRAGLLLAGFFVGEARRATPTGEPARGGTLATTDFADLERPLAPGWLRRWRHDREPWPPGTPPTAHRALRERLAEHPQWAHFPAEAEPPAPSTSVLRRHPPGTGRPRRRRARRGSATPRG